MPVCYFSRTAPLIRRRRSDKENPVKDHLESAPPQPPGREPTIRNSGLPLGPLRRLFETRLFPCPSTPTLFNPYADWRADLDQPGAHLIRRENLYGYLAAYEAPPPVLILAEAPGPRGARFSGVPLTSETMLLDPDFPLHGRPTSLGGPYREYSGGIYWRVLRPYWPRFFTWNSVPLHPHPPGKPLAIRTPTNAEIAAWTDFLAELVRLLQPKLVLAVGRKAELALTRIGVEHRYVRHPSQGGAAHFEQGMRAVFAEAGL